MISWYQKRWWIYGTLVVLIAVDVALYAMWLRVPLDPGATTAGRIVLLQREVDRLSAEVTRLQQVKEHLPNLSPQIATFNSERLLSSVNGFSEVAADLQKAAVTAGVTLPRIDYRLGKVEELSDLGRIEVSTSVQGSYARLLQYIETLERSTRLYIIEDMEVAGTATRDLRLEMKLSAYVHQGRG